ncbi:hypothetical protein OG21DRAFT_1060059 [Imleria badia]|nr:hypothetical protein OG21DRAFT_1060059 [Imleria badia]
MLTAGRTIQGFGAGNIQSLTGIILGDLVTLQERGTYPGIHVHGILLRRSVLRSRVASQRSDVGFSSSFANRNHVQTIWDTQPLAASRCTTR